MSSRKMCCCRMCCCKKYNRNRIDTVYENSGVG